MTMPMAASDSWEPMYFSFGVQVSLEALEPSGDSGSDEVNHSRSVMPTAACARRSRLSAPQPQARRQVDRVQGAGQDADRVDGEGQAGGEGAGQEKDKPAPA